MKMRSTKFSEKCSKMVNEHELGLAGRASVLAKKAMLLWSARRMTVSGSGERERRGVAATFTAAIAGVYLWAGDKLTEKSSGAWEWRGRRAPEQIINCLTIMRVAAYLAGNDDDDDDESAGLCTSESFLCVVSDEGCRVDKSGCVTSCLLCLRFPLGWAHFSNRN